MVIRWPSAGIALSVLLISWAAGSPMFGGELKKLEGIGEVGASHMVPGHTELGIILKGSLASELYDRMPGPEVDEPCTDGKMKSDENGLFCVVPGDGSGHACSFGYVVGTGRITAGPLAC